MPRFTYCRGGIGFLLYDGNRIIWETATMADMLTYMRQHGIQAEYRMTHIVRVV